MRNVLLFVAAMLLSSLAANAQTLETLSVSKEKDGYYSKTVGKYLVEGTVKNGQKDGNWYEIFPEKHMIHRMIQFEKDVKNGAYLELEEGGNLLKKSEYLNDKLNGTSYTWAKGGKLTAKNSYKDDVLDGEQIKCYEQGGNQEIANYKDGERDGLTTWFDQNGNRVMSIEYKAGRFDGEQRTYYKNGNLKSVKNYKDNIQAGKASEYYESGAIKSDAEYKNGEPVGRVKTYQDTGEKVEKVVKENVKEGKELRTITKETKIEERKPVDAKKNTEEKKLDVKTKP